MDNVKIRNSSELKIPPASNVNIRDSSESEIPRISNVNIRDASEKDISVLKELSADIAFSEDSIKNIFVAEKGENIVGYISYDSVVKEDKWFGRHYETKNIVVKDEYLGEGIVTMLIQHLTGVAKSKGLGLKIKH